MSGAPGASSRSGRSAAAEAGEPVRDLADYGERYQQLPFEPLQAAYRRRRVLAQVAAADPHRILEVGCGELPLFVDLPGREIVVVEPNEVFAANARRLAGGRSGVTVVEALLEEVPAVTFGGTFDMVVLSGLLHEVPDPGRLLRTVRGACASGAVVHVNVPHARSLHRLLAVAMGLIESPAARSDSQRLLQQRHSYDAPALERELADAGFGIRARGSVLVKPFTHAQMQRLVDEGFLTPELLDGLDRLAETLPELGSELWVDAVPTDG